MTSEEIKELMYGKFEAEYNKFDRIPAEEKLAKQEDLCAMLYLYERLKNKNSFTISPAHDILYLNDIDDLIELTEEDVLYLVRCGLHYDEENNCFADFV